MAETELVLVALFPFENRPKSPNYKAIISLIVPHSAAALSLALAIVSSPATTVTNLASTTPIDPIVQQVQVQCLTKGCVTDLIEYYANLYGVDKDTALQVAKCESEFKTNAVGDSGKAYGVFQFHEPTFREFAKKFGDNTLEYKNTSHSIELAMWALSQGKGSNWSCYNKLVKSGKIAVK